MRLTEKTTMTVPLQWFVTALGFAVGGAWATATAWFTVKTDIREMKKDIKLLKKHDGIPDESDGNEAALSTLINSANASVKTHDDPK